MTPDKELAAIIAELLAEAEDHERYGHRGRLLCLADRLEALASDVARLRSERDEALDLLAVMVTPVMTTEGEVLPTWQRVQASMERAKELTRRRTPEARLRAVPEALASGIGGAGEPVALTRVVDGVPLDIDDLLAYYNTAKRNWDNCLEERDALAARPSFDAGLEAAAKVVEELGWKLSSEQCAARIRALKAALASPPSGTPAGWQSIESAPKSKTVLVGYPNKLGNWRTVKASFYPAGTLEMSEESPGYYDSDDEFAAEGWYEETETHEFVLPLEVDPTHWMPLPAAPTQEPPQ
jgi:hypothetical protein